MTTRLARLTGDWIAVREIKQSHDTSIIQLEDPNKTPNTVITGIVEQVGPGKRYKGGLVVPVALQVGALVYFEIEMGRARLPWDLSVRIMRETDVAGVVETTDWYHLGDESLGEMGYPPVTPHPDDLSDSEAERLQAAARQNRLLPVREH